MAKVSSGRPLKVFQAQFGFYDTVVAASSQAAALRAWGTHQNLFESGQARITEDASATEAAREHPETPLRRPIGSTDPFTLDPSGKPVIPDEPKAHPSKAKPKEQPTAQRTPPKPVDRSKLDAAELALRQIEASRMKEEAKLRSRRDELEAEDQAAQEAYVERRKKVTAALSKAKEDYRLAGGVI